MVRHYIDIELLHDEPPSTRFFASLRMTTGGLQGRRPLDYHLKPDYYPQLRNGTIPLPEGPGLGMALDESAVREERELSWQDG